MYHFLSLLIGLLSLVILPHVSFVHAGEDQGPTDTPMPTLVPCEKNGCTCRYQVCQKNEWEESYSCGSSLLVCCQPIPTTSTPTPTRTTTPSVPPECPYIPATLWCFDSYSPPQLWWCENQRKTTYHSTCGFGCNATKTDCNETSYCENSCVDQPPSPTPWQCQPPQMRILCWTDRTKLEPILSYFDNTYECCGGIYCDGSACTGFPVPTPFCHPVTNVCHADTLVPPCKDQYPSAPYEWIDNCGGISCLADPCTAPTTAPGDPICVPDCSCAANTCIGQTCTDPRCGGICNGSRDCSVTLTATAKYFASVPANCSDITNPAQGSYLYPVTFTMSGGPSTLISQTLSSPNPNVSWTNVQVGTYNILSVTPASPDYQHVTTCLIQPDNSLTNASSVTFTASDIGKTAAFFVAFGPPGPWHQTREGDVYSGGQLQTYIPSTVPAANRLYSLLGAGGTAGVISAGSLSVVPTPAWRVTNQTNPAQNFYASYRRKAATTTRTPLPAGTVSSFPASSTVYTTTGDLTFGNGSTITVSDGISVVYLVDGNVTISQSLALANPNTSFLAIIASGTISVASTITGSSANPGLDGVFLAGTFRDLESAPPASPHTPLFVRGLVAANTVTLLRDNADRSVPADTFIYNPALPFTMPEWMKDLYYEWREVAP